MYIPTGSVREFPFLHILATLNISSHSLLTGRIFTKSACSLMEVLLYKIGCFPLAPPYFLFNFPHFNHSVSWWGHFLVDPVWGFLCSLVLNVSFLRFVKFLAIMSSKMLFASVSLSCPTGTPIMWMLVCLMLSQRSLKLSPLLKTIFVCPACWFLVLRLPTHW